MSRLSPAVGLRVLALALVLAAGLALWRSAQPQPATPEERVAAIAATLRCPTCQALSVAASPSSIARGMRQIIGEQVDQGRSDDEVRAFFVDRYGPWILLSPPSSGTGAVVWLLPVALVGAGTAAALRFARRRRTPPLPLTAEATTRAESLYAAFRAGAPVPARGANGSSLRYAPARPPDRAEEALESALALLHSVRTDGPTDGEINPDAERRALAEVAAAAAALESPPPPAGQPAVAGETAPAPGGSGAARSQRRRARARVVAWGAGGVAAASLVAFVLAVNLAPRKAGELPTGNLPAQPAVGTADPAGVTAGEPSLDVLRSAATASPRSPAAWQALASELAAQGRPAEAAGAYRRALRLRPGDDDIRVGYAATLLGQGRASEATDELAQVLRRSPNHPEALLVTGLLYNRSGEAERSNAALRRFLRVAPDHPATSMARRLLKDPKAAAP